MMAENSLNLQASAAMAVSSPSVVPVPVSLLESMQNEVKCPICLSVLKQAHSLFCGHCFCIDCISKSMKNSYSCPVCKVPFTKREVRPAPQMDSFATIYQKMELCAGFRSCSQASQAIEIPVTLGCEKENASRSLRQKRKAPVKSNSKSKTARNLEHSTDDDGLYKEILEDMINGGEVKISEPSISTRHQTGKHYFPANKRVQVSLYPLGSDAEDLLKLEKRNATLTNINLAVGSEKMCMDNNITTDSNKDAMQNNCVSFVQDETVEALAKVGGHPDLKPFFWLREDDSRDAEDVVLPSQDTFGSQQLQMTPQHLAFSDLKDSDDEVSLKDLPNVEKSPKLCYNKAATDQQLSNHVSSGASGEMKSVPCSMEGGTDLTMDKLHASVTRQEKCTNIFDAMDQCCRKKISVEETCGDAVKFKPPEENKRIEKPESESKSKGCEPQGSQKVGDNAVASQNLNGRLHDVDFQTFECAFCGENGDSKGAGTMVHYKKGRQVSGPDIFLAGVIHVHLGCAEWAPNVFFKGDDVCNLEAEIKRSSKLVCSICGRKGAALGCYQDKCRKTYHVKCAVYSEDKFEWDPDQFIMLCPSHSGTVFFKEAKSNGKRSYMQEKKCQKKSAMKISCRIKSSSSTESENECMEEEEPWQGNDSSKWVLCGSALSSFEKKQLRQFGKLTGALIVDTFTPSVTHVIASTNSKGACKRTLKYLMAVLFGKWVVSPKWVSECTKARSPVDELPFEVQRDVHGSFNGPRLGRARADNKDAPLFQGMDFYLCGEFSSSIKDSLREVISAAGGKTLNRKPVLNRSEDTRSVVIFSTDFSQDYNYSSANKKKLVEARRTEAKSIADSTGCEYAPHTWVLNSIASCQLQDIAK